MTRSRFRRMNVVLPVLALGLACNQAPSQSPEQQANEKLDRALARKSYGSLLLFIKDHPKSPRVGEAKKAADALAARAIEGYVSAAKGAKGAGAFKEALKWLHQNQRTILSVACKHTYPESVQRDTTGQLMEHIKHGKQLVFDRQKELVDRMASVLRGKTHGVFSVAKSSYWPEKPKEPTLVLETSLAEGEKPLTSNRGTYARLEIKLSLRILWPAKAPTPILDEVVQLPEQFTLEHAVRLRPGETHHQAQQRDTSYLTYEGMRKLLWNRVVAKVYDALRLGSH